MTQDLDYEKKKDHSVWEFLRLVLRGVLIAPTVLMSFGGCFCIVPALMGNDSPDTKTGPAFYAAIWIAVLTAPVGIASLVASNALVAFTNKVRWLWLNWVVFVLHFGSWYLLLQWSQM